MIKADQPTIFNPNIIAAVSSINDGNMRFGRGDDGTTLQNRRNFLEASGIPIENTTLVQVVYENAEHFARYTVATESDKGKGMLKPKSDLVADALVVTKPNHALFLPLADCVGAIIYDDKQKILMLSHLGRQSVEINGAERSIQFLRDTFHTNPNDVKVWLSPAVGKTTYPLHNLGDKGLQEVIVEQFVAAGIQLENIEKSFVDTASSNDYFSHSQFKAGNRQTDGRFAVVAMMVAQGEPAA